MLLTYYECWASTKIVNPGASLKMLSEWFIFQCVVNWINQNRIKPRQSFIASRHKNYLKFISIVHILNLHTATWKIKISSYFHARGKKQQNLQLLDILACNSAKDGIITELWTKISRSAAFASCIARILNTCHVHSRCFTDIE